MQCSNENCKSLPARVSELETANLALRQACEAALTDLAEYDEDRWLRKYQPHGSMTKAQQKLRAALGKP